MRLLNLWTCARRWAFTGWLLLLAASAWGSTLNAPLTWIWANPLPSGNHWSDLAYANGLYIAVAEEGQLYTSFDLSLWVRQASGTTNALRAVTFLGNRAIISAAQGTVLYSDTATNFSLVDLGTTDWLEGLAVSSNLAVAVGDNAAIYTSTDGVGWRRRSPPFNNWLRSVAYGGATRGAVFVVVGETGLIATSPDGVNWQTRASGTTADLNRVVWLPGHFWAVGSGGTTLLSPDGVNWTAANSGATNDLYGVVGNADGRLVLGDNELRLGTRTSTPPYFQWSNQLSGNSTSAAPAWTYYSGLWDGNVFLVGGRSGLLVEGARTNLSSQNYTWSVRDYSPRNWFWDVCYTSGLYVAVGDLATIMTSNDGATWNAEAVPVSPTNTVLLGVAGNANALVSVGNNGTILVSQNGLTNLVTTNSTGNLTTNQVSTFGLVWQAVSPAPTTNDLQGVAVQDNFWISVGGAGTVLTSPDTSNWTAHTTSTTAFLSSVAAIPGGWVSVGDGGTILTSADGLSWSSRNSGTTNWLYRVRYLGGRILAVGENGTILTSSDGTHWTPRASGVTAWLNDVVLAEGVYYIVGTLGTVLSSADTYQWSSPGAVTDNSLYALAAGRLQFVAVGLSGALLRCQLAPVQIQDLARSGTTNILVVSGVPGRPFTLDQSADLSTWTTGAPLQFLDYSGILINETTPTNSLPREFYRPTPGRPF